MACDYGKGSAPDLNEGLHDSCATRLRIFALTDNTALLTAYGNDICYEDVFLEQLKNHLEPGDIALGISGSGGSANVLRALEFARTRGAITVGFTGSQPPAALFATRCDVCLRAPLVVMEQIEDLHVVAHHAISLALRARVNAWHQAMAPALAAD
jgi:D-sedoheptulose 7-phosphate isomerase